MASRDGLALRILRKVIFATNIRCCGFLDHEIGRECRGVDLVVVCTVANERSDEVRTFDWLERVSDEIWLGEVDSPAAIERRRKNKLPWPFHLIGHLLRLRRGVVCWSCSWLILELLFVLSSDCSEYELSCATI